MRVTGVVRIAGVMGIARVMGITRVAPVARIRRVGPVIRAVELLAGKWTARRQQVAPAPAGGQHAKNQKGK
jgi:hypothetical protein